MKKRKSKSDGKNIDLIFLIIFAAAALYFLIETLIGHLLPTKYILIASVVLLIVIGLLYLSIKLSKQGSWPRRILSLVLAAALLFAGVYQMRIRKAFGNIDDGSININAISLVVLDNSSIQSVEELSGLKVGLIGSAESTLNASAINEINDASITYVESQDSMVLANELVSRTIDAALMANSQITMIEKNNTELYSRLRVIKTYEMHVDNTEIASDKDITKEPFTVYISGLDSLGVPNYNGLSDVNMLLLIDPNKHHIEMVSIPRDAYIPNQAYNNFPDKLTHTGNEGIDNVVQSMETVFGFEIDYYAKVSFSSLIEIIDTLGGIDVDVQLEFYEQDENRDFSNQIHLYPGIQTLNGRSALAYARHRHTEGWGDIGRNFAQQQIIQAIINKLLTAEGINKVPDVLQVGAEYVSTNMPISTVKRFINNEINHPRSWSFSSISLAGAMNENQLCVSATEYGPLFVFILDQNELNNVYAKYMEMFEPSTLSDFKFTLDDLNKYQIKMPINEYLLTIDNYQQKMSTIFSSMQYVAPTIPEVNIPDSDQGELPVDDPSTNTDIPSVDPDVPEPDQGENPDILPPDIEDPIVDENNSELPLDPNA